MRNRKIRGKQRQLKAFRRRLLDGVRTIPEEDWEGCGYWHFHMPCAQGFIDASNQPTRLRRDCVAGILQATALLYANLHKDSTARIVCCLSWPRLWDSQIIVFFDDNYFRGFFDRSGPEQTWRRVQGDWLKPTLGLEVPHPFGERRYRETLTEEDWTLEHDLVFIGTF